MRSCTPLGSFPLSPCLRPSLPSSLCPSVCVQDYGGNLIVEIDMVEVDEMEVHGMLSSGANPNIGDPDVGHLI